MSIAVSATVLPSRILACMLVFMVALVNVSIGYAGFCFIANQVYISIGIILCIVLSTYKLLSYYRGQQLVRLDISESGDIIFRLTPCNTLNVDPIKMTLSERSTLWPQLMVLSLRSDDGKIVVLPVLRDSVDATTFRKLSVALNWIAMHASGGTNSNADMPPGNF